jgi:DNA repair protein RadC
MPPESKAKSTTKEEPSYIGHRDRLRARMMESGPTALADYEVLELLLAFAIPRRDTKDIAKNMIKRFGSFAGVMAADPEQLKEFEHVKNYAVSLVTIVRAAAILMQKQEVLRRPVLSSWKAVLDYCHSIMANEKNEQFRLLFLDGKNALIADEVQSRGTVNHAPVYIREVVKRTLAHGAISIIMAHNHPTGDPTPSRDDIEMTRAVQRALAEVGVNVHDHIIIGRSGHSSLRSLGLMDAAKAAR